MVVYLATLWALAGHDDPTTLSLPVVERVMLSVVLITGVASMTLPMSHAANNEILIYCNFQTNKYKVQDKQRCTYLVIVSTLKFIRQTPRVQCNHSWIL